MTCRVGSAAPMTSNGSTASPQLTTSTNGATPVACHATSKTGVQGPTTTGTYDNDSNPPSVTSSEPSQQAWESSAQTIAVTASESPSVSGVQSITCQQNGGPTQTSPGSNTTVTVSQPGTTTISCSATTNAGAQGDPQTYVVNIDGQAPIVSLTGPARPPEWVSGPQTVTATGAEADSLSTIAGVSCAIDGGAPRVTQGATAHITVADDGVHTVACNSTTAAGLQSAPVAKTVPIDSSLPAVTYSGGPDQSS